MRRKRCVDSFDLLVRTALAVIRVRATSRRPEWAYHVRRRVLFTTIPASCQSHDGSLDLERPGEHPRCRSMILPFRFDRHVEDCQLHESELEPNAGGLPEIRPRLRVFESFIECRLPTTSRTNRAAPEVARQRHSSDVCIGNPWRSCSPHDDAPQSSTCPAFLTALRHGNEPGDRLPDSPRTICGSPISFALSTIWVTFVRDGLPGWETERALDD